MTHELWANLNAHIFSYLRSVTLAELVAQQQKPDVTVLQDQRPHDDAAHAAHARSRRWTDRRHVTDGNAAMKTPIYLDYSATTPVDPRVAQKMIPCLTENFGNPASRSHSLGWTAEKAVEDAREQVAALVNCDPRELVWTSGRDRSRSISR